MLGEIYKASSEKAKSTMTKQLQFYNENVSI